MRKLFIKEYSFLDRLKFVFQSKHCTNHSLKEALDIVIFAQNLHVESPLTYKSHWHCWPFNFTKKQARIAGLDLLVPQYTLLENIRMDMFNNEAEVRTSVVKWLILNLLNWDNLCMLLYYWFSILGLVQFMLVKVIL